MSATAPPGPAPPTPSDESPMEFIQYSGRDRYVRLLARLRPNWTLLAGLTLLGAFGVAALVSLLRYGAGRNAPPVDPQWTDVLAVPPGPSWAHLFGVDRVLGIDVFGAVLRATPNDLALVGAIILGAAVLGILLGAWAGLRGGLADLAVVGAADILVGVPPFFLVLVLYLGSVSLAPPGWGLELFALLFALVLWPYYARPVRAMAQKAGAAPYVESARATGAGPARLLFRHVIPNSIYPAFAQIPVDVYNIFFVLTVFPFLGCFGGGTNPLFAPISFTPYPLYPEWGALLAYGACVGWSVLPQLDYWWSYVFPAGVIVVFGLALMLLCDGLERHLATAPTA